MKMNRVVAAVSVITLSALASSTRCFAESVASAKPVAKKAVVKKPVQVKIDLSSPDATVRTFVAAFSAGEFVSLPKCIWGAKPLSKALQQRLKKEFAQTPVSYEIGKVRIFIDTDPIVLETMVTCRGAGKVITSLSRLEMRRDQQGWKIIPRAISELEELTKNGENVNLLLVTATQMADADTVFEDSSSMRNLCQSNLKQVALAAFQFAQENEEVFAFKQSDFVEKLFTYSQNKEVFLDPKTGNVFGMNAQMEHRTLSEIESPAETVLFYTGANGVLDFSYNDSAIVAFADGHVKAVSREEAANLRWKP